ncbi:MAG: type II toxin-antitoxin system HicB family antitoxin [Nitrospirae bacterium]|nr:type II toxin-antitoxin system HicB family antitoxin [Nitrospirota bacterium]
MTHTYTAKYRQIPSGYMAQLIEWPEVITEGRTIEKCRAMLQDALDEMIKAYKQQKREIPIGRVLFEQMPAEV